MFYTELLKKKYCAFTITDKMLYSFYVSKGCLNAITEYNFRNKNEPISVAGIASENDYFLPIPFVHSYKLQEYLKSSKGSIYNAKTHLERMAFDKDFFLIMDNCIYIIPDLLEKGMFELVNCSLKGEDWVFYSYLMSLCRMYNSYVINMSNVAIANKIEITEPDVNWRILSLTRKGYICRLKDEHGYKGLKVFQEPFLNSTKNNKGQNIILVG